MMIHNVDDRACQGNHSERSHNTGVAGSNPARLVSKTLSMRFYFSRNSDDVTSLVFGKIRIEDGMKLRKGIT